MTPNSHRDIIVVGASAGGVQAFQQLVAGLPSGFPAAVFMVLHLWPLADSLLPEILKRAGALPVEHARDGTRFQPSHIYVAPPDHHMTLEPGLVRVTRGPRENLHRPSIDVLFRSAARCCTTRVVGVLLTGADDDGALGLVSIQRGGGLALVQDPSESDFPQMPLSALKNMQADYCLTLAEMPAVLADLVRRPAGVGGEEKNVPDDSVPSDMPNTSSGFVCPECGGAMWERQQSGTLEYRCRVGHAYSAESFLEAQGESVEHALWAAVRSLEENASVLRRLADKAPLLREAFEAKAVEREQYATVIRGLLAKNG